MEASRENANGVMGILNKKYFLIQRLGEGLTGKVYLGYEESEEGKRYYAFKITNSSNPKKKFCLNKEIQFHKHMEQHNDDDNYHYIARYYEIDEAELLLQGKSKKREYIKMDYYPYGSLASICSSYFPPFKENQVKVLISPLLNSLAFLHNKTINIVHCDIKTSNILIDRKGNLRLIDFGFSSKASDTSLQRLQMGTKGYMAPELIRKKGRPNQFSTDIFALGVVLFNLVVGKAPFQNATEYDPLYKWLYEGDYSAYWSNFKEAQVSDDFKALIHSMIDKNVSVRPSIENVLDSPWMNSWMDVLDANDINTIVQEVNKEILERYLKANDLHLEPKQQALLKGDGSSGTTSE